MNSREQILARVKSNQPASRQLPSLSAGGAGEDSEKTFVSTLEAIGGTVFVVPDFGRISALVCEQFPEARRIVSNIPQLAGIAETVRTDTDGHSLENVDLAILPAHFGVAENGACWITESQMVVRVLPFIAQHLALVLSRGDVVPDMHTAYERIAVLDNDVTYGFATFVAGPSKTADIEQSLVLGAHGPASLTVFLLDE